MVIPDSQQFHIQEFILRKEGCFQRFSFKDDKQLFIIIYIIYDITYNIIIYIIYIYIIYILYIIKYQTEYPPI